MSLEPITGIVLAGGRSSRMGVDKALLIYNGISLLENAIKILSQVCDKVVISAPESRYLISGIECWPDELPVNSAMTGVYSCLKRSETQLNMVLSCDMPLIKPEFLKDLLAFIPSADAVIPVHEDMIEPLCAIYTRRLLPSIEKQMLSANYSMHEWIINTKHKLFAAEQSTHFHSRLFININRVEDFNLLVNS